MEVKFSLNYMEMVMVIIKLFLENIKKRILKEYKN